LQDTNALVINSVVPALGVSVARGFHMNSICIPRLAGEAAGAIARLEYVYWRVRNMLLAFSLLATNSMVLCVRVHADTRQTPIRVS
jgi:hypothetical protein